MSEISHKITFTAAGVFLARSLQDVFKSRHYLYGGGGGGVLQKKLGRGVRPAGPKTLTLFMTKICDFPYPIYDPK